MWDMRDGGRDCRDRTGVLGTSHFTAFRGEHYVEVFRELGLSEQEIKAAISSAMLVSAVPESENLAIAHLAVES